MKMISLWSGPRNVSTALMYSFARRPDTRVVDEPLYGYYLQKTGADHPGREEILDHMIKDPAKIFEQCENLTGSGRHLFMKNMAHHAIDLPEEWFMVPEPVFLIRDPADMLPSLHIQLPRPELRDTGLLQQVRMVRKFLDLGKEFLVIDSRDLLRDVPAMMSAVCRRLDLPFYPEMLTWKAGPLEEDGIWAKYWYHQVHQSTGFGQYHKKDPEKFPESLTGLLEECRPHYEYLSTFTLSL